ncbi:hypothetical protein LPJ61_005645 [Coemansia biformis]|uniref:Uncharacterized protein n=1 Tax=Coemansia biformis TaxID=1286918 RepID=A0A9W7Y7M5_9FUNG|nr:hypothetical protein LPJ61_005645 [Coemansia biformis]
MADEVARLLRLHWLRLMEAEGIPGGAAKRDDIPLSVFDEQVAPLKSTHDVGNGAADSWALGGRPPHKRQASSAASAADPLVADRFKLMSPQTPYYLFVAGKVQAARLKQVVTAQSRNKAKQADVGNAMDVDQKPDGSAPDAITDAIRRIDDIWSIHGLDADAKAIEARLDDIINALEYCQLFWYSLNFASHLKYLKEEAAKPLLCSVYRE